MSETECSPLTLIVDDEADIRELLTLTLSRMGVESYAAETIAEARELLAQHNFDLCLTDMRLPDGNGIELIYLLQKEYPDIPVAMITAHGNMELAIEALKAGAFDFLNKPVELQALRELVGSALRLSSSKEQESTPSHLTLLGGSAVMEKIRATIAKLARSQAPVYISGESGTGKELVARLIHAQGPRADKPFVPVNCGAIPSELMESELFGYKKGSFTGATTDKQGLFQAANGGTLFLDEVADLPLSMQVKLLRAIQEKAVRPVGAQEEDHVDIRILSATHKDLAGLVKQGAFREDLFYRLNVIELPIPPLRERREDIPLLVDHILERISSELGIDRPSLSDEAQAALGAYPFSGNIRELENILERACTLCEGNLISGDDLHLSENRAEDFDANSIDAVETVGLEIFLEDIERQAIVTTLEKTDQNKTAAAKLLGLTFRSLRYRLKKLGLD
jgi:two-component system response regulator PilR (NtrC family)